MASTPEKTPKIKSKKVVHQFSLDEHQNKVFMQNFKDSTLLFKSDYIIASLLKNSLEIVVFDKGTLDYYMRLTSMYTQFRLLLEQQQLNDQGFSATFTPEELVYYTQQTQQSFEALRKVCLEMIALTQEFERNFI